MRTGIFGGSFDPVHFGHLLLAETCREACRLDRVWFMPAAAPPHKLDRALSDPEHRLNMLRLAVGGHEAFHVSRLEIDRGDVSYTVDTLRELSRSQPQDEFFLLLGADMLHDLPTWREPAEVLRLAWPAVVHRGGFPPPDFAPLAPLVEPQRLASFAPLVVPMPRFDLSSRDIRSRVAEGRSIRYQVPRAVEMYIATHGLYRASTTD